MSLTALLKHNTRHEVRAALDPLLTELPGREIHLPLQVPCACGHPQLVGIAFDYAVRLELAHRAPHAVSGTWAAEHAVARLERRRIAREARRRAERGEGEWPPDGLGAGTNLDVAVTRAEAVVRAARRAAARGWPANERRRHAAIARHAARLAQLDPVYRAHRPPTFGEADGVRETAMAEEVVALMGRAEPLWQLASARRLHLNPGFGPHGRRLGGADADLIADDTVIELKVWRRCLVERDHARQLAGYAALARVARREAGLPLVRQVAIWFARHGWLYRFPLPRGLQLADYRRVVDALAEAWPRTRIPLPFGYITPARRGDLPAG
jgi:hypothetical protein